jgi:Pentapeptide repeats (8 copies)
LSDTTADTAANATDAPKIGIAWGDDITEERQHELDTILAAWDAEANHSDRKGPFDPRGLEYEERELLRLTGADVFYLAAHTLIGTTVSNVNLVIVDLAGARAALRNPELHGILNLSALQLASADLIEAQLTDAVLSGAQLMGIALRRAQLERANLTRANLEGANFYQAQLEQADLRDAQLIGSADERAVRPRSPRWGRDDRNCPLWCAVDRCSSRQGAIAERSTLWGSVRGRCSECGKFSRRRFAEHRTACLDQSLGSEIGRRSQ